MMSATRPLLWRYADLSDQSTSAGAGANTWLDTYYATEIGIDTGETVLRTRLQINMTFGWQSVVPDGGDIEHPWYDGQSIIVGLYCNPDAPTTEVPPNPRTDLSDGYWLQNNALTPHQVNYNTNYLGQTSAEVLFKFDSGTSESFAKRGPSVYDGADIFLAWDIASFGAYWLSHTEEFLGWMGGSARWAALVETAA